MRWGFNNLLVGARSGSSVVTTCQENPYAALRIAAAGAFSHKDSLQARSGHALRPRPRFESCSAACCESLCKVAAPPTQPSTNLRRGKPRNRKPVGGTQGHSLPLLRLRRLPVAQLSAPLRLQPDASRCFCLLPLPLAFCFFHPLCLGSTPVLFVLLLEAGVGK